RELDREDPDVERPTEQLDREAARGVVGVGDGLEPCVDPARTGLERERGRLDEQSPEVLDGQGKLGVTRARVARLERPGPGRAVPGVTQPGPPGLHPRAARARLRRLRYPAVDAPVDRPDLVLDEARRGVEVLLGARIPGDAD